MATDGTTGEQTDDHPDDPALAGDVPALEERAKRAAELVEDGFAELDELTAHEHADRTDEEIREAVAAELERRQANDASVVQETDDEPDATITSAAGVDWPALWAEFGFDSVDAHGNKAKSKTKVHEAVRVSEQPIQGDASQIVSDAVENGTLVKIEVAADGGASTTKGYILQGGVTNGDE